MADPNNPRKFTEEFRRQIVQLYLAGRPRGELMAEYDLGSSTLSRWIKGYGEAGVTTEAAALTPPKTSACSSSSARTRGGGPVGRGRGRAVLKPPRAVPKGNTHVFGRQY